MSLSSLANQSSSSPYALQTAKLVWPKPHIPEASQYGDIYFSKQDGLEESRYVFLQQNHLQQRWQQLEESSLFTIGETGFGTGLNFLSAWQLWQKMAPDNARLHFVSVEKHPLTLADLQTALSGWTELDKLAQQLIANYPVLIPGQHVIQFGGGKVTLHLLLGEAVDGLEQLRNSSHPRWQDSSPHSIDAWFLDGFAPAKNPSLWNSSLYSLLADLSHAGTTVATFTAVGEVRRGLIEQGFAMEKVAGYGSKREMLRGCFDPSQRQASHLTARPKKTIKAPWSVDRTNGCLSKKSPHIAVIGGGLAGTSSAYALAKRGYQVTLVERTDHLASGASGNPQGMLYTTLSPQISTLNQFTLSSYLFALRYYRQWQLLHGINRQQLDFCGLLQLATSTRERHRFQQLTDVFASHPQLVQCIDSVQASEIAGVAVNQPGCWFPQAGWVSPIKVCETQASHTNISQQLQKDVDDIARHKDQWLLLDKQQNTILKADIVIVANSRDARQFAATSQLPLKTIRGQISLIPTTAQSAKLKTVICHEGYITPAINGQHNLGATFSLEDCDTAIRAVDHQANLDSLHQALPSLGSVDNLPDTAPVTGRASLRCTTPDYLPMVGPVYDHQQFLKDYAPLGKNALADIDKTGCYHPNLYINVGHGSRGLTSTPMCSELLAAIICGEPPPVPRQLSQALNPARFVIRNLIRNQC